MAGRRAVRARAPACEGPRPRPARRPRPWLRPAPRCARPEARAADRTRSERPIGVDERCPRYRLPFAYRPAGRIEHLERRTIRCPSVGASDRAASRSSRMSRRCSFCGPSSARRYRPPFPDDRRHVGHLRQALEERAKIEPGAADENREAPGQLKVRLEVRNVAKPLARRVGSVGERGRTACAAHGPISYRPASREDAQSIVACIESVFTTKPPVCSAIASASADLPLAVGPAIRTAFPITARPRIS